MRILHLLYMVQLLYGVMVGWFQLGNYCEAWRGRSGERGLVQPYSLDNCLKVALIPGVTNSWGPCCEQGFQLARSQGAV